MKKKNRDKNCVTFALPYTSSIIFIKLRLTIYP